MRYRSHRWPSRLPVKVGTGEGEMKATLVNVSREGARLSGLPADALEPGTTITMAAFGLTLKAEVRWHLAESCGLSFAAPLAPGVLARLRQAGIGRRN